VDLFAEIGAHFKSIVPLPQEITEGITEEQFVRNVAEVLFVTRRKPDNHGQG
jgi:hypothetical protein